MKGNDDTVLRWVVLRVETTGYWEFTAQNPPESRRPDRVWTVYLVSMDLGVHICSVTPSAEMWFVENYPEWDEEPPDDVREAWHEWTMTAEDEQVIYMDLPGLRRQFRDLSLLYTEGQEGCEWRGTPRSGPNWCYVDSATTAERDALLEYVRCNAMI